MDDAYEAVGLRDTGDIFTVEILGPQREAVAVHTAQMWADQWQVTVGLYRVPFVNFGSAPWRPNQMRLVRQFVPTRIESKRGIAWLPMWSLSKTAKMRSRLCC